MHETQHVKERIWLFTKLYIPVTITQLCLILGAFFAVFQTGQYNTDHLAGFSIGYNIWITLFTGTQGIFLGITPIISQLLGAQKEENLRTIIHHAIYLSVAMGSFFLIGGFLFLKPFIYSLTLTDTAREVAIDYMTAFGIGVIPLLYGVMLRNILDTFGKTHLSMAVVFSGFLINVVANYLLIFGNFGFPELGGVGAGFATALLSFFNAIACTIILWKHKHFKSFHIFSNWSPLELSYWLDFLRIGIPIGISIFAEVSIFALATFTMTYFGTEYVAAHQAAYSFTNIFYCFPLSISIASTIAVAYEVGAKRYDHAKSYSNIARAMAILIAIIIASYSFTHLDEIASIFSKDAHMVTLMAHFLSYALFFSVIDAWGTPVQGILRAYKDVKVVTLIAISCYWGAGVPLAYLFALPFEYGPYGIWVGMLGGVGIAGVFYIFRPRYIEKKYR